MFLKRYAAATGRSRGELPCFMAIKLLPSMHDIGRNSQPYQSVHQSNECPLWQGGLRRMGDSLAGGEQGAHFELPWSAQRRFPEKFCEGPGRLARGIGQCAIWQR